MALTKPVLVVAPTIKAFDAWLKEQGTKRLTSRPQATVGKTEHFFVEINRRAEWLNARQFSKIVYTGCNENDAFDWFKSLINSRVKSPASETQGQAVKKRSA